MEIRLSEIAEYEVKAVHVNLSPPLAADIEGVEHFHIFVFNCKRRLTLPPKSWSANNLRDDVERTIHDHFADHKYGVLNFESNDCISLAELLISKLDLDYCSVVEKGIGGAEISIEDRVNHFDLAHERMNS